ncbi:MAG: prolipoprotein diacylglyceryl transferase [Gammaproteobacteria bacterium]
MWEYTGFDPIALQLGPLAIRWYGLMYLTGFVGGWLLMRYRARQPGSPITVQQADDVLFYIALGVILGGRIGYMLFYGWSQIADDPLSLLKIWQGGMSFHGGFIGVMVGVWLFGRKIGTGFWPVIDVTAPAVTIGLGAGRIGNFINGELWGRTTDVPWAFIVNGEPRHPTQLYEALLEGVGLFLLLWIFSARPRPVMAVSAMFLVGYGTARLIVEFFRLPDAHIGYLAFGWFTMGMLLTVPMILAGFLLFWIAYRRPGSVAGTSR